VPGALGRRRLSQTLPTLLATTDRAYLQTPLRKWCNDQVQYALVNQTTGYLRILSFSDYSEQPGFANGLTALQTALDHIFSDPKLKVLVIDVRINFGGNDLYGVEVASRLATADYLGLYQVARDPLGRGKPGSDLHTVQIVTAEIDADVDNEHLQLRIGKDVVEGGLQRCQPVRKPGLLGIVGEGEDTQISRGLD